MNVWLTLILVDHACNLAEQPLLQPNCFMSQSVTLEKGKHHNSVATLLVSGLMNALVNYDLFQEYELLYVFYCSIEFLLLFVPWLPGGPSGCKHAVAALSGSVNCGASDRVYQHRYVARAFR